MSQVTLDRELSKEMVTKINKIKSKLNRLYDVIIKFALIEEQKYHVILEGDDLTTKAGNVEEYILGMCFPETTKHINCALAYQDDVIRENIEQCSNAVVHKSASNTDFVEVSGSTTAVQTAVAALVAITPDSDDRLSQGVRSIELEQQDTTTEAGGLTSSERYTTEQRQADLRNQFQEQQSGPSVSSSAIRQPRVRESVPSSDRGTARRYIVVDGSNVAYAHGGNDEFSPRGIEIVVDYFISLGHIVKVILPQGRQNRMEPYISVMRQYISFVNSSRSESTQVIYRCILQIAEEEDGIIVSNSRFQGVVERESWQSLIEERILNFTFVDDRFIPRERAGRGLETFLARRGSETQVKTSHQPVTSVKTESSSRSGIHYDRYALLTLRNTTVRPPPFITDIEGITYGITQDYAE